MPTTTKTSLLCLLVGLFFAATLPHLFNCQINFVAAPLVMLLYNAPLSLIMLLALASGCLLDALTLSPALGFLGLSYVVACRILYSWRLYLFKDYKSTLPIMCAAFTALSFFLGIVIGLLFDFPVPSSPATRLAWSLVWELLFCFLIFMLPTFFWQQYRLRMRLKRGSDDS